MPLSSPMPQNLPSRWSLITVTAFFLAGASHAQPATAPKTAEPAAQPAAPAAKTPDINPATTPVDRKDDWWKQRQAAFNERVKQGAEKGDIGILFIGDSITQGWEGAGKEVWQKHYAKRNAVNLGIGGDRTQHVLWRLDHGNLDGLDKPSSGSPPALAVLMIGTNNVHDTKPEQTAEGVAAIVAKLRERLPRMKILVLAIFPREAKPGDLRKKNEKVNERIELLADNNTVFFRDISPAFLEKDGTLPKEIMPDELHLSPKGYQIWAEAIEADVKTLLKEP